MPPRRKQWTDEQFIALERLIDNHELLLTLSENHKHRSWLWRTLRKITGGATGVYAIMEILRMWFFSGVGGGHW